jgi:hypothetical protein
VSPYNPASPAGTPPSQGGFPLPFRAPRVWSVTGSPDRGHVVSTRLRSREKKKMKEDGPGAGSFGGYGRADLRSELYDPATVGTWSPASAPSVPRAGHNQRRSPRPTGASWWSRRLRLALAEILRYRATGEWTWEPGAMSAPRSARRHRNVVLMDGNVLLVGGYDHDSLPTGGNSTDAVSPEPWSTTGPLERAMRLLASRPTSCPAGSVAGQSVDPNDGDLASSPGNSAENLRSHRRAHGAEVRRSERLPSVFHAAYERCPTERVSFVNRRVRLATSSRSRTRSALFRSGERTSGPATGAWRMGVMATSATVRCPTATSSSAGGFCLGPWLSRSGLDTVRPETSFTPRRGLPAIGGRWAPSNETRRWQHGDPPAGWSRVGWRAGQPWSAKRGCNEVGASPGAALFGVAGEDRGPARTN